MPDVPQSKNKRYKTCLLQKNEKSQQDQKIKLYGFDLLAA
jgi:hypothetical protein